MRHCASEDLVRRAHPGMTSSLYPPRTGGIDHLVASAAAAIDFLAGAELEILAHADPHFAEPGPVAGTAIAASLRPGLTLMKASSISDGATVFGSDSSRNSGGNFHRGARLADGLEISPRRQPRAGAVLVPLVEDQPGRRHQIQHRGHDVAIEPRRGPLAIFGKAMLVLRPQAVDHEGKRPPAALGLRTPAVAALRASSQKEGDHDSDST